jgi:AcrR family transcriptional regulator
VDAVEDVTVSRRERYAEHARAAVLDAARALFLADGFDKTSIDDIALASQSSKGAVYHHFRDKREIFAEVFRVSQARVASDIVGLLSAESTQPPWERVEIATRLFLRSYDASARELLRQALGVLGWDWVRAIDELAALPVIRATLQAYIENGHPREVPVNATAELYFGLYCNALLYISAAPDPDAASREAEAVIFTALNGLKATSTANTSACDQSSRPPHSPLSYPIWSDRF